ncbi:MAG TPA: phosphotransferase [Gaiellales bacterium]|nr:phosphotransferase [Gaiellales bacterium]
MFGPNDAGEVARRFSLGAGARLTGIAERGEQGEIRQLATDRGTWAVKLAFGEPEETDGEDAAFQEAARRAGVPAPAVVRTGEGGVFAEIAGVHVRVYGWVDVLPADRTLDPARVGRLVAGMHGVAFAGRRPEDRWYTDAVGAAAWDGLIEDLAAAGAPFTDDLAVGRDDLVAAEALIEPASDLRTCHRDLWADNLRGTGDGGLCVIDWENCGRADPGQELAGVLFEFWLGEPDRARELHREYRRAGGPGRVESRGSFSMSIAQLGHITEIACRIWLGSETSPDERLRQEARVGEATGDALTVRVIDEILDAVAGEP